MSVKTGLTEFNLNTPIEARPFTKKLIISILESSCRTLTLLLSKVSKLPKTNEKMLNGSIPEGELQYLLETVERNVRECETSNSTLINNFINLFEAGRFIHSRPKAEIHQSDPEEKKKIKNIRDNTNHICNILEFCLSKPDKTTAINNALIADVKNNEIEYQKPDAMEKNVLKIFPNQNFHFKNLTPIMKLKK